MPTFRVRDSGWIQAIVRRKGYPVESKSFETKREAQIWAREVEGGMDRGTFVSRVEAEATTLHELIKRYRREILPAKRGKAQDEYRLQQIDARFGKYSVAAITPTLIAEYRDERLGEVSAQTVVHDINMLSRLFKAAVLDWGIALPAGIPTAQLRKPRVSNARERRFMEGEETWLFAGLDRGRTSYLRPLVRLAIETGARQSELISLDWRDVDLSAATAKLRGIEGAKTKNEDTYREVPLSPEAVATLQALRPAGDGKIKAFPRGAVFPGVTGEAVKQSWQLAVQRGRTMYCKQAKERLKADGTSDAAIKSLLGDDRMLIDLRFHDLRHEAISRLAGVFAMHELMKITGHKGATMLARYYHPDIADLAKKLRKS